MEDDIRDVGEKPKGVYSKKNYYTNLILGFIFGMIVGVIIANTMF